MARGWTSREDSTSLTPWCSSWYSSSSTSETTLARYRLRFQLQEIDLVPGETIIGRSPDCHVTVEDPLVSRRHARIRIEANGGAFVEDMGSRNGVSVNGQRIDGSRELTDADRIRIGTQEFVFHVISDSGSLRHAKDTGFLRFCERCRYPFPEEIDTCPNCGYSPPPVVDESTLSGVGMGPSVDWASQLLLELLERSLSLGQWEEALKVAKRVTAAYDEYIRSEMPVDLEQFEHLVKAVSRVAQAHQDESLVEWLLSRCERVSYIPGVDVVRRLIGIPTASQQRRRELIERLLLQVQAEPTKQASVEALQQWRRTLS